MANRTNFVNQALSAFINSIHGGENMTPIQTEYVNMIKNNDSAKGEETAINLCRSMGMTKEQAIAQARQYFGI